MKNNSIKSLIINNESKIDSIDGDIKYLNIDISNVNKEIMESLFTKGEEYYYSDNYSDKNNYIYTSFDKFHKSYLKIKKILDNKPSDATDTELFRYIYIALGKIVVFDIKAIISADIDSPIQVFWENNNIFSALSSGVVNRTVLCKLFVLICTLCDKKAEVVKIGDIYKNKVNVNNDSIVLSLYDDLSLIYGGFKTKFFGKDFDDVLIDRKIKYIKDEYNCLKLRECMKNSSDKSFDGFLKLIQNILNFKDMPAIILKSLLNNLFEEYGFLDDTLIIDCYYNNKNNKDYFPLIFKDDKYYSFNYKNSTFMIISLKDIKHNIKISNIGLYMSNDMLLGLDVEA